MPSYFASSPWGNDPAASVGSGMATCDGSVRRLVTHRPTPPIAAAAAVSAPAAISTPRLDGALRGSASADSSRVFSLDAEAAVVNHHRAPTPARAVARAGTASRGPAVGRSTAARPVSATSPTSTSAPRPNRRRASTPPTAASSSAPAETDPTRIGLSAVPNRATAHSLTGVGVRSMTVEPMASTGEEAGLTNAATRWPAAIPTSALRIPKKAYCSRCRMGGVRCGRGWGWVSRDR